MMLSREAIILNYAASAAWKYHDLFGVGVTLEWISVPRLNYSLVIDGTPFAGAANPVSSHARHAGDDDRLGSVHLQRHPGRLVPARAVPAVRRSRGRSCPRTSRPTAR